MRAKGLSPKLSPTPKKSVLHQKNNYLKARALKKIIWVHERELNRVEKGMVISGMRVDFDLIATPYYTPST